MVKEIIGGIEGARYERCHLKDFGDSALNYETVFFVESQDYNQYMDIQEKMNLELKERFEKEGIGFAYPTRTIYIEKES